MRKSVAVITFSYHAAKAYTEQLQELFGDYITVTNYSLEKGPLTKIVSSDIIVVATSVLYEAVKKFISAKSEIVIIDVTISKDGLKRIAQIPAGTQAMLVNISPEMAIETIALIYHLGVNHIELVPVYPGMREIPKSNIKLAITPGEKRYVPPGVGEVIDIGNRLLDTSTIVEIALKLELDQLIYEEKFQNYFGSIVSNSYSFGKLAYKTNRLESQFDILLKILNEGIIGVNADGFIFAYNDGAENILGLKRSEVLGKEAFKAIPDIPFNQVFKTLKPIESKLIKIKDTYISLNLAPVISMKNLVCVFAIIKRFKETETQQYKLRAQLLKKGYRAKYNFIDIIGESPAILKAKDLAKKMAKIEAPVLITGETGTGKELFAQAIHNNSSRKDFPFVAVNCAAIPENLLETELFGYEEGAFTGAKKGGKYGLLEFAHLGTLFLDEIGEMSFNLQAKLLRVIQEKEVMRIGGERIINVDVRIIAATNRNLKSLVEMGKFRKDLFYRLDVLPLNIPPLKERKEDILLLANTVKKQLNSDFEFSDDAKEALLNHTWDGNVRELRNYIELFTYMDKKVITLADLPFVNQTIYCEPIPDELEKGMLNELKKIAGSKLAEYVFVMDVMASHYYNRTISGRRSIAKAAENEKIFLTEQEIRTILIDLKKCGVVNILKGRGGSKITRSGIKILNYIKNGFNG